MHQAGFVRPASVFAINLKKRRRATQGPPAKKRIGLSQADEAKIRFAQLQKVPSAYYVDVQFTSNSDTDPDGNPISYRFHRPPAFPPKADSAPMCKCRHCQKQWDGDDDIAVPTPADYREGSAVCVDHLSDGMNEAFGQSPSAKSIAEAQMRNIQIEEYKLENESRAALRKEIKRFIRRKQRRNERAQRKQIRQ